MICQNKYLFLYKVNNNSLIRIMKAKKTMFGRGIILSALFALLQACSPMKDKTNVAMIIPVSVDAFAQVEEGLREVCDSTYEVRVFSAEGQASKMNPAIDAALITKPNYLVAIGTQVVSSLLTDKYIERLPSVVAGAISVPSSVEALVKIGLEPPRTFPVNIVSQVPSTSYAKLVDVLMELNPNIDKIGIIYNESELNSNNMKNTLSTLISDRQKEVLLGMVTSPEDVSNITNKLIREGAKAIIIPHDKSATAKAATVAHLCNEKGLITCSLDDNLIKDGVAFAVTVPYKEVGRKIGQLIREAKEQSADLGQMPLVQFQEQEVKIFVNTKLFQERGYALSDKGNGQIVEL